MWSRSGTLTLVALLALPAGGGLDPPGTDEPTPGERMVHTVARAVGAAAAAVPRPHVAAHAARWEWPVPSRDVLRPFDPPDQPWLPGHRGVDLAGTEGTTVRSVADGVVTYSGTIAGVGIVSVTHADGVRSTYQPLTDRVSRGERVGAGERVGVLEASHCAASACLHLGALRGDAYLDPMRFLEPLVLALLPEGG